MNKTYWNNEGKFQDEANRISELIPSWGKTENKYLDLYITASGVYYDMYNNGGCNIRDSYITSINEYIRPFARDLKGINFDCTIQTIYRNLKNEIKLENFMDSVIEFVSKQDLSYKKYCAYYDYDKELLSYNKKDGFKEISFGNEKDFKDWTNHRINVFNYTVV